MSTPIIPWMGGKRRPADRLIPLFPPHECYVEVFASGAALYFMRPQAALVEVLNDINGDLVTLYRVVQNHLEEFVRQFKWALSSRQVRVGEDDPPQKLSPTSSALPDCFICSTMPLRARSLVRHSELRPPARPLICCGSTKVSRPPGSVCPAPTLKTCHCWNALNATTVPIPSITWTRLNGRPPGTGSTFRSRTTNGWPTSCAAAKAR